MSGGECRRRIRAHCLTDSLVELRKQWVEDNKRSASEENRLDLMGLRVIAVLGLAVVP